MKGWVGENLEWWIFVQKFWVILVVLLLGFVQSLEFLKKSWNLQSKWKIWNLQSKWKIEVRSEKMVKVWSLSFSKLQQVLTREYFSYSQIPFNLICSKGIYYNHRMTSFRTLSCPHCTVVTVCLQCIHEKKPLFLCFSRSQLILESEFWIQISVRTLYFNIK